jgi:CheY-like chemotaxis protein
MGKFILLLDDNSKIRQDLSAYLKRYAYAVYEAENKQQAREIILSRHIDYAVIDLKLDFQSDYGGIETINLAKRHQPHSKVIGLSGFDLKDVDTEDLVIENLDEFVSKTGAGSYLKAVRERLEKFESMPLTKHCFVIMPFSTTASCTDAQWDEIFAEVIKPGVEKSGYDYCCTRSNPTSGLIIEHILDNLNRADLVIADLTDRNPNVFYELGIRHTLRDSTILIAQKLDDIPFDLRGFAIQVYGWKTKTERKEAKRCLKELISRIEKNPKLGASKVREYLQI